MSNISKLATAFSSLLLLLPLQVLAEDLTIGVETTDYYPQYQYKNNKYGGYAREIIDLFAASNGHTVTYKAFPIKRLLNVYLKGEVDLKYPDNAYWASAAKKGHSLSYSKPVVDYIDGVLVVPERKDKGVGSLKRLGTIRGFTAFDYLEHMKSGKVKLSENESLAALIKQASNNRIDGAYFNVAVAKYFMANTLKTPDALVFDAGLPHTKSSYSISSIKRGDIVEQFDQFLVDKASEIQALKDKYQVEAGVN